MAQNRPGRRKDSRQGPVALGDAALLLENRSTVAEAA